MSETCSTRPITRTEQKAAAAFGGWSDISLMKRTYTHAEQIANKVHEAQLAGMARAEAKTNIKLRKT